VAVSGDLWRGSTRQGENSISASLIDLRVLDFLENEGKNMS